MLCSGFSVVILQFEMSFGAVSTMLVYCAVAKGFSAMNNNYCVLLCFSDLCNFNVDGHKANQL